MSKETCNKVNLDMHEMGRNFICSVYSDKSQSSIYSGYANTWSLTCEKKDHVLGQMKVIHAKCFIFVNIL